MPWSPLRGWSASSSRGKKGRVALAWLPTDHSAFSARLLDRLLKGLDRLGADPHVRVEILGDAGAAARTPAAGPLVSQAYRRARVSSWTWPAPKSGGEAIYTDLALVAARQDRA